MVHQIDAVRDLFRLLGPVGVDHRVQPGLQSPGQRFRPLLPVPEGLRPVGHRRGRQAVLVDAQQHRVGDAVDK